MYAGVYCHGLTKQLPGTGIICVSVRIARSTNDSERVLRVIPAIEASKDRHIEHDNGATDSRG